MELLWSVLVTGLFAGGASCAAVQGGLLAGLVARRQPVLVGAGGALPGTEEAPKPSGLLEREDVLPVGGFLAGKLLSHTVLGGLLGMLGAAVQLTANARAVMQLLAGLVMVVLAIDLLGFHAVRRLIPQPPARALSLIRNLMKSDAAGAPALLGVATVVIPCGVTLSVEALAIASGSVAMGAAIMAIFVIGTSPLFAVLGYAARRSAAALRGKLSKIAGVAVAITGLLAINSGLILAGSPVTISTAFTGSSQLNTEDAVGARNAVVVEPDGSQRVRIDVLDDRYAPSTVEIKSGQPTRLALVTNETRGCTRSFALPAADVERTLPKTGETIIELGVLSPGVVKYTCGMGMYSGKIVVS